MGQKKLERFEAIKHFKNVLEYPQGMEGKWSVFFGNNHPITLELACGKGEYALGLGRLYKDRNFIGVDVKGNRIWKGAKTALGEGLTNVAFLRTQIEKIETYFSPGEVNDIWITFPDPQLRLSRMSKRLTHPKFLRLYQQILAANGQIHLKTDSPDLYQFTCEVIRFYGLSLVESIEDINAYSPIPEVLAIKTYYEGLDIAKSKKIFYLCFKPDAEILLQSDMNFKNEMKQIAVKSPNH